MRGPGGVLPLDRYAAVGDGRSVAIVGADGSVDWWCVPGMGDAPLFDRLIAGDAGGRLSVTPEQAFTVGRAYRPDSNVLEHTYTTAAGRVRVAMSLNSGPSGRLPWSELAIRIDGLEGTVVLQVELRPAGRERRATPWLEDAQGGVLHLDGLMVALRANGDVRQRDVDGGSVAHVTARAGSRSVVALLVAADGPLMLPDLGDVDARLDRSDQAWREWAGGLAYGGPYAADVRRSALALKLLLYSPTGAIAAAATMGLPERIGGDKNYDYRYAWVRDVAYTVKAFLRVGALAEARAGFAWLMAAIRRHGPRLRPLYTLDGALPPEPRTLDLPGYAASRPVVAGNEAAEQLQLGTFGDVLETALLFVSHGHVLDLQARTLLSGLADQCADRWRQPDAGIWELPQAEHYTMSKMGCWTALDRAVRLADAGQLGAAGVPRWRAERDRIRDWVDAHCWSEAQQSYVMHPGTERLDASLLLAARLGFERQDRLALTRDAVVRTLARGPLVYRYTGAEQEEGTFLACAFWLVEAYALLGGHAAAVAQMDALLARTGTNLGLLHEQQDAGTGAMLGNMPQALSHLALVHAALSLCGSD